jgi:hypothetical protein
MESLREIGVRVEVQRSSASKANAGRARSGNMAVGRVLSIRSRIFVRD